MRPSDALQNGKNANIVFAHLKYVSYTQPIPLPLSCVVNVFCWCLSGVSNLLGVSQFFTNLGLNCLSVINIVPVFFLLFFCGQDNLQGGQFWAMGRFNLLGGKIY